MPNGTNPVSFLCLRVRRVLELRTLLAKMAFHDLRTQFAGSVMGVVWSVVHPLVMALVLWFVFSYGIRSAPVENIPFHVWLFCGIFPWTFFSEALSRSCTSLQEKSYLVKQPDFCVALVPTVSSLSTALVHLVFIAILLVFALASGVSPSWHWLQLAYYAAALLFLSFGLGWLVSSLQLFLRDTAQVVNVLLQLGFWLTPIFWQPDSMPSAFTRHLDFSPVAYVIAGYRQSLFGTGWFWQQPSLAAIFWVESLLVFFGGLLVFRRLRPHFLDMM